MEQWVISDWNEFDQVIQYARLEGGDWDWIWLDSVSLVQDQLLQSIWDDTIRGKPERAKYRADKLEYGVNMWRLEQWVRHTVAAQTVNIGITAHPWTTNNPFSDEGGEIMLPWIQGNQMSIKICAMMTIVAYTEVRQNAEGVRWARLHTQGNETFYGKDQYDAFGENGQMDNPTLAKIDAAIRAAKTGHPAKSTGRGRRGAPAPAPTRGQRGRGRAAA